MLQKQTFTVPLSQGVDTKTDPTQVPVSKLLTLENGVFVSPGRISKRNGYARYGTSVVAAGTTKTITGSTVPALLDVGWPVTANDLSTYNVLPIVAPAPAPPGGPRLLYATFTWKTFKNPAGFYYDITSGTGVAIAIADTNGVVWTKIADANFQQNELTPGHHGIELWAAWYPGPIPAGTVVYCLLPNLPVGCLAQKQFVVYSRHGTASGALDVTNCFGNIYSFHNVGAGFEPNNLIPITEPMLATLTFSSNTSAGVYAGQDGIFAAGIQPSFIGSTLDDFFSVDTRQSAVSLEPGVTGPTQFGASGTGAWTNVLAAEILGGTQYSVSVQGGITVPPVSKGNSIFTLGDQLLLHDGETLYTWGSSDNAWYPILANGNVGGTPAIELTQTSIVKNNGFQAHPDQTVHPNGYTCVAYEDTVQGGVRFTLLDTPTQSPLAFDAPIPTIHNITQASTYEPKLISFGKWILLFYTSTRIDSTTSGVTGLGLYCAKLDTTNAIRGFQSTQLVHSDFATVDAQHAYDVSVVGTRLVIAATAQTGATMTVYSIDVSGTVSAGGWTFVSTGVSTGSAVLAISVFPDSTVGRVVVAWTYSDGVKFAVYTASTLSLQLAPAVVEAGLAAAPPCHLTGSAIQGTTTNIQFWYTIPARPLGATPAANYSVRYATVGPSYVVTTFLTAFLRSVGLAGKAFQMNGIRYVPLAFESVEQPTNFVADEFGNIVARIMPGTGIGQLWGLTNGEVNALLPEASILGNTVNLVMQERFALGSGVDTLGSLPLNSSIGSPMITLTTSAGVTNVALTFGEKVMRGTMSNTAHFSGGLLWMYDGATAVEHGFHLFPEGVVVANPGGSHVYQYVVVYTWMDMQGNLHRSAPSTPVTQAQSNPIDASAASVTLSIPTLRLTAKQNQTALTLRQPVVCEVYRTEDDGSLFYRVTQRIQDTLNSTLVDSISFLDTTPDYLLIQNQQLYTTGGALENDPAPATAFITTAEARVWLINSAKPQELWYSKETIPGAPVEFSNFLTFNLESMGQNTGATAIARLDDKTVVFRETAVSYIIGQGPDAAGQQNDFREVQLPLEVGCTDPSSVVVITPGVIFKGAKGFYLLDRGLNAHYIGADVEAYNNLTITSATALPKTNWVIFGTNGNAALVFDYFRSEWAVWPGLSMLAADVYQSVHAWVDSSGVVHQETPGVFSDGGAYIPLKIKTAWVQLAGVQGFKRIWEILILGSWFSSHRLQIDITYNYDGGTVVQTNVVAFPSPVVPLQLRVNAAQEQCQAIQVTLTELPDGAGTIGEGLNLSSISMNVGVRTGLYKLPSSKSVG